MKNFKIPDWENNKIGDKASKDFENVGALKKKKGNNKNKNVAPAAKNIQRKSFGVAAAVSPNKNQKKVEAETVALNGKGSKKSRQSRHSLGKASVTISPRKEFASPHKTPKKAESPQKQKSPQKAASVSAKTQQVVSPKIQKQMSPMKKKSTRISVSSGHVTAGAKSPLPKPASPKKMKQTPKKAEVVTENTPNPKTPKRSPQKQKSPQKAVQATKMNLTLTPKAKTPKKQKFTNPEAKSSSLKKRSPNKLDPASIAIKKADKKKTPKKALVTALKAQSSQKPAGSPQKKSPRRSQIAIQGSPKTPKAIQQVASLKPKQKSPSPKKELNAASVAIKKKKTDKKAAKSKIKIAGLLGTRKTRGPTTDVKAEVSASDDKAGTSPKRGQGLKSPNQETSPLKGTANKVIIKPLQSKSKARLRQKLSACFHEAPVQETLNSRMMSKLKSARFRFINEELYTKDSSEAVRLFREDPEAFQAYHDGYRQQVKKWPLNPLSYIIASIQQMPANFVVADFGCGDADLSKSIKQKVHSFDLVASNDTVTACDMAKVPLKKDAVDVAVFCLSLMGTNLQDYILEANRVLKVGGILKIAEVESRFDKVETFIAGIERFGFQNTYKNFDQNLFYFMDFRKKNDIKKKHNLPTISLLPCMYKKR